MRTKLRFSISSQSHSTS